jgi:hypothetical protein
VNEANTFRYVIGIIAVIGGLCGLAGLYAFEVPEGNREALLLALGIVLGWGGSVVNGEWGSSPAGRDAAKVGTAVAHKATAAPTGKAGDLGSVEVEQ